MARKLVVELISDPRGYTRGLETAAKQTKLFGAEVDKMSRGILSGSGAISHLGRSIAFASGGFLAFEGVTKFLTDSVSAARDAGVAQKSLTAQMKASGESFTASKAAVEQATLSLEKYGFTSEDSEKALTVLERGTGNITKAISLQGVAANLARAKNIDLASAANVLAKVFGGQETALRRAVPGLEKHAHGLELIREAQQKLAGQAAAATTPAERFAATLHNTEVIVGTALLPTLNKYLTELQHWLDRMNRSGRLQKDVNEAVKTATALMQDAAAVIRPLAEGFKTLGDAVGGTKNEVELLGEAFLAFKAAKILSALAGVQTGIKAIGTTAVVATGEIEAMEAAARGGGKGPGLIGGNVATAAIAALGLTDLYLGHKAVTTKATAGDVVAKGSPYVKGTELDDIFRAATAGKSGLVQLKGGGSFDTSKLTGPNAAAFAAGARKYIQGIIDQVKGDILTALRGNTGLAAVPVVGNPPLTAGQQLKIGLAAHPQSLALLRQQAGSDQAALDFAKKLRGSGRISNAKYVSEVTAYASDLQQTNATISGILQAARQKTVDASKAAAAKQKQATQAALQKAQQAQQNMLDALQFNVDKTELTKGQQDNLRALEAQKAGIQKMIATEGATRALLGDLLNVELAITAKKQEIADARKAQQDADKQAVAAAFQSKLDWAQVAVSRAQLTGSQTALLKAYQQQLAITNQEIRVQGDTAALEEQKIGILQSIKDAKTQQAQQADQATTAADQATQSTRKLFKHLNATAFVNQFGAGSTREQRRRLEIGLAVTGPGGTLPAGHSGQFMAGITINGGVHMHGVQDVAGLENQIAKRAKARPFVRRGARG